MTCVESFERLTELAIYFSPGELTLYDRMTSADDLDVERIVHHRTVVMVLDRQTGERRQHVEPCQLCGVELYGVDILRHLPHELRIYASLYDGYLLLEAGIFSSYTFSSSVI